jgi:phosphoglucosamine mutase
LFGHEGARGRAGTPPLDHRTIRRLGGALVRALAPGAMSPRLLVGRDTRESGEWIEQDLALGAAAAGADVESAGIISTPAIAYLTSQHDYTAGLVISASHNPYEDNGIKVFSGAGEKFTERLEAAVEAIVADPSWQEPAGDAPPVPHVDLTDIYLTHARSQLGDRLPAHGRQLAVDCANGAAFQLAPRLFRELGFDVVTTACEPNGRNINLGCGSTHPQRLAALVVNEGLPLGVAFDGDGDRAIFADAHGRIVDGDAVMYLCAKHLKAANRLRGDAIVATVMSNVGLELALSEAGIGLVRCQVGDKYVMEEMLRRNLSLGGEQSGHVIFADALYTGDGLITALNVLRIMAETGESLAELAAGFKTYPQVLCNVRVREKRDWKSIPRIAAVAARVEQRLAGRGRLLVRYSGTEPLLRVMIEGEHQENITAWAEEIAQAVREEIGE